MAGIPYQCAPGVSPATLAAIVRVESRGNPLAIHDNTSGRGYTPASESEARALLSSLLKLGHSVDAGLMQINSRNFKRFSLSPSSVFNSCVNVNVGGNILRRAWVAANRAGMTGQTALWHAVQAYNSGNLHGSPGYARQVWAAAGEGVKSVPYTLTVQQSNLVVAFAQNWSAPSNWGR